MPPFKFERARADRIIAYVRNMRTFDQKNTLIGDAARGRAVFEGKGQCATLPPRERQGAARRARPERHRRLPHA